MLTETKQKKNNYNENSHKIGIKYICLYETCVIFKNSKNYPVNTVFQSATLRNTQTNLVMVKV